MALLTITSTITLAVDDANSDDDFDAVTDRRIARLLNGRKEKRYCFQLRPRVSGAFQGQIFGFSGGKAVRDENCERLKLSKYLYDTGMKVAAVSILCQDPRVFKAMEMAGTPCPYMGKIGEKATVAWSSNMKDRPDYIEQKAKYISSCTKTKTVRGVKKSRRTCEKEFNNS